MIIPQTAHNSSLELECPHCGVQGSEFTVPNLLTLNLEPLNLEPLNAVSPIPPKFAPEARTWGHGARAAASGSNGYPGPKWIGGRNPQRRGKWLFSGSGAYTGRG